MHLVDLVEKRRFMGREFMLWLWFQSEIREGRVEVEDFGPCEIWLEGQLTLVQEKEQTRLKGATPSTAPEAKEALRQGKMPTQARVRVERGELAFTFLLQADSLGLSGVRIPAEVKDEGDERFYERMYLVEELEALVGAVFADFLAQRLSPAWEHAVAPAMRAWIRGEAVDTTKLGQIRAPKLGGPDRPTTMAPPAPEREQGDEAAQAVA